MTSIDSLRGGIIAIIRLDDLSIAIDLANAIFAGGVRAIEFPLTNPKAVDAVRAVRKAMPNAIIGTGSVLTSDHVIASIDAGADFLVAPVTDPWIIELCVARKIPIIPGAMTPTEAFTAHHAGASAVKIFPARQLGPAHIKDLLEPMPFLKLIPTGGVTPQNTGDYFKAGAFALGVGGSIIDKTAIANRDWNTIEQLAREFVR